jgi:hypothetical protein
MDRWRTAQQLLHDSYGDWALRTFRSQVMGAVAAQSGAINAWCSETPDDPDALMMRARVLTERAVAAGRRGLFGAELIDSIRVARVACHAAAQRWPADPVPWVCLLTLARLDIDQRAPHDSSHWAAAPEPMLPPGPWPLLDSVNKRHPRNREAHIRLLQVFEARGRGGIDFARAVAAAAQPGSPLLLLPLYAYVESYRLQLKNQSGGVIAFWSTADKAHYVETALYGWFAHHPDPARTCSPLDLNYLAYVLTVTGVGKAADVFEAIGPYATPAPWSLVNHDRNHWQDDFHVARRRALGKRSRR